MYKALEHLVPNAIAVDEVPGEPGTATIWRFLDPGAGKASSLPRSQVAD